MVIAISKILDISRIWCFELNALEKYNVLERVFEAVRDESYFQLRRKDARTKIGNFAYIAADTHTIWKKVKRM